MLKIKIMKHGDWDWKMTELLGLKDCSSTKCSERLEEVGTLASIVQHPR